MRHHTFVEAWVLRRRLRPIFCGMKRDQRGFFVGGRCVATLACSFRAPLRPGSCRRSAPLRRSTGGVERPRTDDQTVSAGKSAVACFVGRRCDH